MEVINITSEQRNNLCSELAQLLFEFKKYKSVKCIYFAPYYGLDTMEGSVLKVTLVRDGINDDLEEKIQKYNFLHKCQEAIDEFGLRIYLDSDTKRKYTLVALNPDEIKRENYLFNSIILYDEDGECTKIRKHVTNSVNYNGGLIPGVYYYFENLSKIEPPIEETLEKAIDNVRDERDTEAVKEFTKSRIFQQFKGI